MGKLRPCRGGRRPLRIGAVFVRRVERRKTHILLDERWRQADRVGGGCRASARRVAGPFDTQRRHAGSKREQAAHPRSHRLRGQRLQGATDGGGEKMLARHPTRPVVLNPNRPQEAHGGVRAPPTRRGRDGEGQAPPLLENPHLVDGDLHLDARRSQAHVPRAHVGGGAWVVENEVGEGDAGALPTCGRVRRTDAKLDDLFHSLVCQGPLKVRQSADGVGVLAAETDARVGYKGVFRRVGLAGHPVHCAYRGQVGGDGVRRAVA